jgi:hypothetical protein
MPIYMYDDVTVFGLGKYIIIYFNNIKWESNIEMNLKELFGGISWTTVLQKRNLLTREQIFGFHNVEFLTRWVAISFPRKTLYHWGSQ